MAGLHITDIESAINWWRRHAPGDGVELTPPLHALAEVYALMVHHHETTCDEDTMPHAARDAWLAWYDTTPDAPCIAICSTSQGDELCKGCGRSFDEVQNWPVFTPGEKRETWRRITLEGTAWRFNRYAERAIENRGTTSGASGATSGAASGMTSGAATTAPSAATPSDGVPSGAPAPAGPGKDPA
ncbi:Fe-S protein [Roseateles aquatilis]|uniref:Fe-S protein n=1 Tax=Roseateles aquatilis TaxID=431061 RepID=A0A246JK37_9BURK|nr:Fe-S protein [Roseateles aquatilis]